MFDMIGVMAEFERWLIQERVRAGPQCEGQRHSDWRAVRGTAYDGSERTSCAGRVPAGDCCLNGGGRCFALQTGECGINNNGPAMARRDATAGPNRSNAHTEGHHNGFDNCSRSSLVRAGCGNRGSTVARRVTAGASSRNGL
jgi:hypothetical protein